MTSAQLVVEWQNAAATPFDYSVLVPDVAEEMRDRADPMHNIRLASVLGVGREDHGYFPPGAA